MRKTTCSRVVSIVVKFSESAIGNNHGYRYGYIAVVTTNNIKFAVCMKPNLYT